MTPREISILRRELLVRHDYDRKLIPFVGHAFGPEPYVDVAHDISENHRLSRPSAREIAALVCAAFSTPEAEHSKKIIEKMQNGKHIYGFTGLLHIPGHGAYVEDNPSLLEGGRSIVMRQDLLEKKMAPGARDGRVRFALVDKTGDVDSRDLTTNALIANLWGVEAGEKFARTARDHRIKFYISSMDDKGKYFLKAKTHPNRFVRVAAMSMPDRATIVLHADCPYDHQDIKGYSFGVDRKEIILM